ncbi:hypothetical protein AA106556_1124 [Neokomagataea tanensis NBRC 106556]|uniref:DUF1491 domain-containing protein n=2 Tax=Acetobacteraceae TaxID=433 RepID=A0ABQ0QIY2_9PROT|nr:hypothetical protein AA106556_1124 [Neokomagataea tanensis NBRC 106556]
MVLHRGDEDAGAIIILLEDRARHHVILREDNGSWVRTPLTDNETLNDYIARQQRYDPDLWVIELTVPDCAAPIEQELGSRTCDDDEAEELFW